MKAQSRDSGAYQVCEDTFVQVELGAATLEQVVVVILETLPVGFELLEAVGVDILDPIAYINTRPE